jgi:hypothetical protein
MIVNTTSQPTAPVQSQPPDFAPPLPIVPRDFSKLVVAPAIQRSLDAFRAALPELLKNKIEEQEWVAFCGDQLICFGRTQIQAYQDCLRRGLKQGTFIVMGVDPEINEIEIMHEV